MPKVVIQIPRIQPPWAPGTETAAVVGADGLTCVTNEIRPRAARHVRASPLLMKRIFLFRPTRQNYGDPLGGILHGPPMLLLVPEALSADCEETAAKYMRVNRICTRAHQEENRQDYR